MPLEKVQLIPNPQAGIEELGREAGVTLDAATVEAALTDEIVTDALLRITMAAGAEVHTTNVGVAALRADHSISLVATSLGGAQWVERLLWIEDGWLHARDGGRTLLGPVGL